MPASPSPSSSATDQVCDDQVQAVRAFNRFYTRKLGVLDQQLLKTPFSLSEARVLYELAHGGEQSAKEIGVALGLDAGYLSRIVQNFDESGLIVRKPLATDRRQYQLSLTAKGRQAFAKLDRVTQEDVAAMLRALPAEDRTRLTGAMEAIERLLGLPRTPAPRAILREPRPGDMGWVVQSHGALYASEYGFDSGFEALVAEIVAKYMTSYDGSRERCWIADIEGRPVGSVFLVKASDDVAKLRLLLLDPAARGQGLGQRLVAECVSFARACGYRRMTLWTQSILVAARHIYEGAGFKLVATEPHRSFGQNLIGETWERNL
ncbi:MULTISPECIES: helix-turn-helix domain-containing GNAT family N-acetyltransferase [unclassified Bradyrhizobium]|uniref:bifunctional helix-turn-helix transcriptional regulator/GNAT family N-acetyltransferase n=1 Tax=unclassified Bradyrhizobium TaxID=2631580 RepID=UPI001FF74F42|nr:MULTISPECIES: helix-turn-helix domain-containing GNAT family N-acetyltransferase [unclassified Bradyrhizobium]MCK1715765.1 MarR family transcriptional regulator [Bradyrhizobium sp. 143]MCK1728866.1 MarR family transcriptional regulator [Bradyrhizobium sp. 142]